MGSRLSSGCYLVHARRRHRIACVPLVLNYLKGPRLFKVKKHGKGVGGGEMTPKAARSARDQLLVGCMSLLTISWKNRLPPG